MAVFLIMYIASEINITSSSYGVRRKITLNEYELHRYNTWCLEKRGELKNLYEQEYCESMQLIYDDFCYAIYNEYEICYEN